MTSFYGLGLFGALALVAVSCSSSPPPAQPPLITEPEVTEPAQPATPEPPSTPETVATPEPPTATEEPPGGKWETKDLGVEVPDAWRTCSAAADCELVVTTCCDQCNGGKAVSVAKSHAADVRTKFKPKSDCACTKRGCSTRAACEAGRCVLQWQSFM